MEIKQIIENLYGRFNIKIRKKRIFFNSLGISIFIHVILLLISFTIIVPGMANIIEKSGLMFNLKSVKEKPFIKTAVKKKVSYLHTLKFESPALPKKGYKSLDIESEASAKEGFDKEERKISKPVSAQKPKELDGIENVGSLERLDQKTERKTRKEIIEVGKGLSDNAIMPEDIISEAEFSEDFVDRMPGVTPEPAGGFAQKLKEGVLTKFGIGDTSPIKRKGAFSELEELLVYSITTYEDPADGKKYYKIAVQAGKDVDKLKRMPKEMLFVIDCSLSIQKERLEQSKQGLLYCLKHLNPEDVFNMMAFKERTIWFKPNSVKPEPQIIKEAMNFIETLTAGEATDTYKALLEAIKGKPSINPSYIIMFSDGRPTYGVTDSRKIINEISKTNNGAIPIFVLSGGQRVNRYLLDFISYKNRGWAEYAQRSHYIAKNIAKMYEKIKDPVFLNMRYRVNGLDENEIFPKMLPDFFRHAELNLYGEYENEEDFSFQLLGDIGDEINEFIIIDSFKNTGKGDKNIAREWALNKIYYLIGRLESDSTNKEVLEEISGLCNKFGIKTPYLEDIEKK